MRRRVSVGDQSSAFPPVACCLNIGVTGHRDDNLSFTANREGIATTLDSIFDAVATAVTGICDARGGTGAIRVHSLLAAGTDQMAAHGALRRAWQVVAPLPMGLDVYAAIAADPQTLGDADALLAGGSAADPAVQARASAIRDVAESAQLFELAEADAAFAADLIARIRQPGDTPRNRISAARLSARIALAAHVMLQQCDILVAVWDGATDAPVGGTGHTVAAALAIGAPVLWIDARAPETWRILHAPESLRTTETKTAPERDAILGDLVGRAISLERITPNGAMPLDAERTPRHSNRLWHSYRRIETMFGGEPRPLRSLRQQYKLPEEVEQSSAAAMLTAAQSLPDRHFADRIRTEIVDRFARADAISANLSDAYRGSMTASFILSALAIIAGMSYQPFAGDRNKWMFAAVEFTLLVIILVMTAIGTRRRWHSRWFETRRVAEYLRHAPSLLLLGVARPPSRWPRGARTSWPEDYARQSLRSLGLPHVAVTAPYIRTVVRDILGTHVRLQRDYHLAKARRLNRAHHNLDRISLRLFQFAVISVACYLVLSLFAALGVVSTEWLGHASKPFTYLGVLFPTVGAALAGIRYFGDFERFAAISEVTATKLDAVLSRIDLFLTAPDEAIDYALAAELVHAMDEIVVTEIENWQAVFGGKHITVPV